MVFGRGKWVAFADRKLLFFVSIPPWTHMRSDGTSKQRVEKSRRVYWFWVEKPKRI